MRSEFSVLLDGRMVCARQEVWRVRPIDSAIDAHGFHQVTVMLEGTPSYLVMLCISEHVHREEGCGVRWLVEALTEWLERSDKCDADIIELVA